MHSRVKYELKIKMPSVEGCLTTKLWHLLSHSKTSSQEGYMLRCWLLTWLKSQVSLEVYNLDLSIVLYDSTGDTTTSESVSPGIGAYQLKTVHMVLTELDVQS